MGNCKSHTEEPKNVFEREKKDQEERETERKRSFDDRRKYASKGDPMKQQQQAEMQPQTSTPNSIKSYHEEAIERMKNQLNDNANAFLLNNILLSVQFFDNYEKQLMTLKKNPVSEEDTVMNENLGQHYKHVYTPDKLQEVLHTNVRYLRKTDGEANRDDILPEPFYPLRMFVVHDNIEASEPGDETDYSTVMDTAYYKMLVEESKEAGFVKLRCLEVIQNTMEKTFDKETNVQNEAPFNQSNKLVQFSGKETELFETSDSSDDEESNYEPNKGQHFLNALRHNIEKNVSRNNYLRRMESISQTTLSNGIEPRHNEIDGTWKKLDNNVYIKINDDESQTYLEKPQINYLRPNGILRAVGSNFEPQIQEGRRLSGIVKIPKNGAIKGMLNHGDLKTNRKRENISKVNMKVIESLSMYNHSPYPSSSGSDSDYGYTTITKATTPKPLELSQTDAPGSTSTLPKNCLTSMRVTIDTFDIDDELQEDQGPLFIHHYYLNGTYFMEYFIQMFIYNIGNATGFSSNEIQNALTQGASIYCDGIKNDIPITYEILPTVYAGWPNVANEWLIRPRRIIQNPRNNFTYQWPTPFMVEKARTLGCMLLPLGFRPPRDTNEEQIFQWKICFPAVERYFELCLAHSQVRCFMFTLCLVKTFMETDNVKLGLDSSHIKAHLFTQCEDNYAKWPEDRLGESLQLFLKSLYYRVMKRNLPCFFIPDCNLLKGIPKTRLLEVQRQIAYILESPVSHMLYALQNLYFVKKDFYPILDYLKLYKILISDEPLTLLNPNLSVPMAYSQKEDDSDDEYMQREKNFWEQAKSKDRGYNMQKKRQKELAAKNLAESDAKVNKKRKKLEINPTVIFPDRLEPNKRRLVLGFFIPHFIKMAEYSNRFGAAKQGLIYLEHAHRLCTLLSNEPSGEIEAQEYKDAIWEKVQQFKANAAMANGPKMPKRNSSFGLNSYSASQLHVPHQNTDMKLKFVASTIPKKKRTDLTIADIHQDSNRQASFEPAPISPFSLKADSDWSNEEESRL